MCTFSAEPGHYMTSLTIPPGGGEGGQLTVHLWAQQSCAQREAAPCFAQETRRLDRGEISLRRVGWDEYLKCHTVHNDGGDLLKTPGIEQQLPRTAPHAMASLPHPGYRRRGRQQTRKISTSSVEETGSITMLFTEIDVKDTVFIPGFPVKATITDVIRQPRTHPINPNLYTIELSHGEFKWTIRRRYKHFLKLDTELFFDKVRVQRQNSRREHKHTEHLPRRHLPRRPDMFAVTSNMNHRKENLERYLRVILDTKRYLNHKETLSFLEVSQMSFHHDFGEKRREGVLKKRSGGHRFPAGCCSCCGSLSCGIWTKRWLLIKDSFVAYVSPKDKQVHGVILLDKEFTFKYGLQQTGLSHGLLLHNQASEWMKAVADVMATTGAEWVHDHPHDSYAPVRIDSPVKWFIDGASYFEAVASSLEEAEEEILIAGWWVSPELHLCRPVTHGNDWRLDQILKRKAESGVKIYILLYKEVELALTTDSAHTKAAFMSLHPRNIKVLRHPDHVPGSGVMYWAHHEKLVVVDQKVAYLGGLDLCFGRWDDPSHRLTDFGSVAPPFKPPVEPTRTEASIGRIGSLIVEGVLDSTDFSRQSLSVSETDGSAGSKLWLGKDYSNPFKRDFFEVRKPYQDSVDRCAVPRMPWHDVGVCVFGFAARDAARHFVLRWNATKIEKIKMAVDVPLLLPRSYTKLKNEAPEGVKCSKANCQILRSLSEWSGGVPTERSIHTAYVEAINSAQHFIYIENQFFISSLEGEIKNKIGEALYKRIVRAHREGSTFRVIVVVPLLPAFQGEVGTASGISVGAVQHWNYRTICRCKGSLLSKVESEVGDPSRYISFFGLRAHAEIHGKPITEILYVHSKMMIVDDKTAIIGSANINDRSMLGRRDSELAVIVHDKESVKSKMDGEVYEAGKFAFSLRTALFKEHLGILDDEQSDAIVQDPVADHFYENVLRATAQRNTEIFEEVFHCIPSDEVLTAADLNQYKARKVLAKESPWEACVKLREVKGHLVNLPLRFLEKENLRPPVGTSEFLVSSEVFC